MDTFMPTPNAGKTGTAEIPHLINLSEGDRNAMRSYLQRTEVRISTLHRIATAFVGGAGLMLLIPIFLKDVIDNIIRVLLTNVNTVFAPDMLAPDFLLGLAMYGLAIYPLIVSLAVPMYALYLLLKDIVHFYFTLYAPGFSDGLQHPTFSLSALTFSSDESPEVKREVMRYQYSTPARMRYMIPFSEKRREAYFDHLMEATNGSIIPVSRRTEKLQAHGVLTPETDLHLVEQFNTAMGIARALDRTLVEEVAYQEMALVRNVLYLRRLVLRYVKAMVMFIWTTLVAFIMLPLVQDERVPIFVIMCGSYLVWAVLAMPAMRMPIGWMYRHRRGTDNQEQVDVQLRHLEYRVRHFIHAAIVASAVGLVVAVVHFIA